MMFWEREKTWSPGISTAALITTYMSHSLLRCCDYTTLHPSKSHHTLTHRHKHVQPCSHYQLMLYIIHLMWIPTSTHFDWPRVPRRRVDRSGNLRRMICTSTDKSITIINQQYTRYMYSSIAWWANHACIVQENFTFPKLAALEASTWFFLQKSW